MPDPRVQFDAPHRVRFTRNAWLPDNPAVRDAFAADPLDHSKALVVVDRGYLDAVPDLQQRITAYFARHHATMPTLAGFRTITGGETAKNDLSLLEALLRDLHDLHIDRRSYLLALGGGAVLDMAGFAAAVTHRGVRLLRMPTTTLAQCDSGVGVKNSVNMFGVKNLIGSFAVPHAVVNDLDALDTLPDQPWRSGLAEAVKVALLKDATLYQRLHDHAPAIRRRDPALSEEVWRRTATLHLEHICTAGDPFESKHARPLDFGHWAAHRLEEITRHVLPHGQAVAVGLALDTAYAARINLLPQKTCQHIHATLQALGLPTTHPALADPALIAGLERFREHLGGQLALTLLQDIAQPIEVHEVHHPTMHRCALELAATPHLTHLTSEI